MSKMSSVVNKKRILRSGKRRAIYSGKRTVKVISRPRRQTLNDSFKGMRKPSKKPRKPRTQPRKLRRLPHTPENR